jgi:hypothetical protein
MTVAFDGDEYDDGQIKLPKDIITSDTPAHSSSELWTKWTVVEGTGNISFITVGPWSRHFEYVS